MRHGFGMSKSLITALVLGTAIHWPALLLAQDNRFDRSALLLANIQAGSDLATYLATLEREFQRFDSDGNGIDPGDLSRLNDQEQAAIDTQQRQAVAAQERNFLALDANRDGTISAADIALLDQKGEWQVAAHVRNMLAELERRKGPNSPDRDGNGSLSRDEIVSPASSQGAGSSHHRQASLRAAGFAQLMTLDTDGDGRLTAAELAAQLQRQFAVIDRDGDGRISTDEHAAAAPLLRHARMILETDVCPIPGPPLAPGTQAFAIGAARGAQLSTLSIAGQDQASTIIDVVIEPGDEPLYALLFADAPVIWRITGDSARAERIVVFSGRANDAGQPLAAVTGVPAEQVSFAEPGCIVPQRIGNQGRGYSEDLKVLIGATSGVRAKALYVIGGATAFSMPAMTTQPARGTPPAPAGFDADQWWWGLGEWPRGLDTPDANALISPAPTETYRVLPGAMGLAQLITAGTISPTRHDGEYRIRRSLERFPAGSRANWVVPANIAMPAGQLHSGCIFRPNGDIVVGNERSCPRTPANEWTTMRENDAGEVCLFTRTWIADQCHTQPEDGKLLSFRPDANGRGWVRTEDASNTPRVLAPAGAAPPAAVAPPEPIMAVASIETFRRVAIIPAPLRR